MSLKITRAGVFDTIQDNGRYGYQQLGINPGGAMDRFSASLANALLGKELNAPVVEMHFPAAQILFEKACVICITGADFSPAINGISAPIGQPILVNAMATLQFTTLKRGARCYLSTLNEWGLDKWLNSYSTNVKAGAGGFLGRRLEKNDLVSFASLDLPYTAEDFIPLPWKFNPLSSASNAIEFIPGNEWNWLTTKSQTAFLASSYTITTASDRMGYRLEGEELEQKDNEQLISSAVSFGTVQRLPNGQLIVLMADHQTTGGYPRIAHVISADLPRLAQMKPNETIKFIMTDIARAEQKIAEQQNYLLSLQNTCNLKMKNWLDAH